MRLVIPCFVEDRIYIEYEADLPKGKTLASTVEIYEREGVFQGVLELLTGCIRSFLSLEGDTVTEQAAVKKIIKEMPYVSAEEAALSIMARLNPDDKIEGVYTCPRCSRKIITGFDEQTGEDSRDTIENLKVNYLELNESQVFDQIIYVPITNRIYIKDKRTDESIDEIYEIGLRWPTIQDCINGSKRYPTEDVSRQYAIYASAIDTVNGEKKSVAYKSTWGMFILNNMESADLKKISNEMKKYGIAKTVSRTCNSCGKVWEAPLNTANFFASGLQSQ